LTWLLDPTATNPTIGAKSSSGLFGFNTAAMARQGFVFRINPQTMAVSSPKARDLTLVKSGYQNIYWYDREQSLSLAGTTGAFGPIPDGGLVSGVRGFGKFDWAQWMGDFTGGVSDAPFDITLSSAWRSFERLQQVFDAGTNELYSLYTDDLCCYTGVVDNFTFTRDANDPFQIRWNLIFTAFTLLRMTMATRETTQQALTFLVNSVRSAVGQKPKEEFPLFITANTWKSSATAAVQKIVPPGTIATSINKFFGVGKMAAPEGE
jgi:hypothetical protein